MASQLRGVSSGQPQLFAEIARSHDLRLTSALRLFLQSLASLLPVMVASLLPVIVMLLRSILVNLLVDARLVPKRVIKSCLSNRVFLVLWFIWY
jgi:hypothetical protein